MTKKKRRFVPKAVDRQAQGAVAARRGAMRLRAQAAARAKPTATPPRLAAHDDRRDPELR
jgi:hypothetical protein